MTEETRNQPGETELSATFWPGSDSPREKSTSATAVEQDGITPAENGGPGTSDEDQDKSKLDNVRVHVTRRSTGTSKNSSKKSLNRNFTIRWPNQSSIEPAIHWYVPVMMVLLGLAGLLGALGHHLYNTALHGKPVNDPQWPQRWGVALAFFVKMTLVGAVQMAVKQRAWLTVKKRGFRIKTLDSIFHSCTDPAEFLDRELFRGAFFPALLSLLVWILPLSSIASPSTLTTGTGLMTHSQICANVSNLYFNYENGFGIEKRDLAVNKQGMSYWDNFENGTSFFNQPSSDCKRIFQLSLLSSELLAAPNPCPTDSNCTYSVSFAAPAYKCEPRDDFGGPRAYNISQLLPYGTFLWGSYSSEEEDFVGRPLNWNRINMTNDTGVFHHEPTLWVGWVYNTTLDATPENATQWNTTQWPHQLKPHVAECTLWNSTYTWKLEYLQGKMNVSDKTVRHDSVLLPEGQAKYPYEQTYMEFAGFHNIGWQFRQLLIGNLTQMSETDYVMTNSDISTTTIIDPGNGMALTEDLIPTIEDFFHRIYLSFLSDEVQQAQVYQDLPCDVSAHVLVWNYRPTWLAVSYLIAVGFTFAAIAVGMHAIASNGYVAHTNFSTFLTTTRNPDLDRLAEGSCLGEWPMKRELRETRLRFGQTSPASGAEDDGGVPHAAFGFEDKVTGIEKGKCYS